MVLVEIQKLPADDARYGLPCPLTPHGFPCGERSHFLIIQADRGNYRHRKLACLGCASALSRRKSVPMPSGAA